MSSKPIVGIMWISWGPYHLARLRHTVESTAARVEVYGLEISGASHTYAWVVDSEAKRLTKGKLHTLAAAGAAEGVGAWVYARGFLRWWAETHPDVMFVPSYSPASSLLTLLLTRLLGGATVMMNDTHAGSTDLAWSKTLVKKILLRLFDAALLAGAPQMEFFTSLGFSPEKMRIGYDVVDNAFFARRAEQVRADASAVSAKWKLPGRYVLSLGRFEEKKNLGTLIRAYAAAASSITEKLVFVGSGSQRDQLLSLCAECGLRVWDEAVAEGRADADAAVYFYNFKQIEDLPEFYALATAFILPSRWEEWGLVVNEAMACGIPVLVSDRVGCARDLAVAGVTGDIFPPDDVARLTDLLRMVSADRAMGRAMGQNAARHIAKWGCEKFAASVEELAVGLARERGVGAPIL